MPRGPLQGANVKIKPLPTILTPVARGAKNNPSDIDAIGTRRASIPRDLWRRLNSLPEFDWIQEGATALEQNSNFEKFLNLNPQFDIQYRHKFKHVPTIVVNRDGSIIDLATFKRYSKRERGRRAVR